MEAVAKEMVHVFAQFGPGPYTVKAIEDTIGGRGACCDLCGTGLRYLFHVSCADDYRFIVGSECVQKSGDAGLIKAVKDFKSAQRSEKREASRKADIAKRRIAALRWAALQTSLVKSGIRAYAKYDGAPVSSVAESAMLSNSFFDNLNDPEWVARIVRKAG